MIVSSDFMLPLLCAKWGTVVLQVEGVNVEKTCIPSEQYKEPYWQLILPVVYLIDCQRRNVYSSVKLIDGVDAGSTIHLRKYAPSTQSV